MTALLRVHHALKAAGLSASGHPERITNALNEVWSVGDYIVRINPKPGAHRLQDEARLLLHLPAEVRAPYPVASGPAAWGEWVVSVRLPGLELSRMWAALSGPRRERAVTELGHALESLHGVAAADEGPPGDLDDCPHPLPAPRLLRLLAQASELPGVDPGVMECAAEHLVEVEPYLDVQSVTMVHGDLHLENILGTEDGAITGLLDFEWACPGPPDLDLDIFLHALSHPSLHHTAGGAEQLERHDFDAVVGWLRAAYPALFAHPHLAERMWVYRLAYDVHDLLARTERSVSSAADAQHHPYQRIVRHVGGRSDLSWFLAG